MEEALYNLWEYLDLTVTPLLLRRLEVLRYKGPHGQTQTAITQTVISMFRDAKMHNMNTDELLQVVLLNTVQTSAMMTRIQEKIDEF